MSALCHLTSDFRPPTSGLAPIDVTSVNALLTLSGVVLLFLLQSAGLTFAAIPTRAVIEQHLDRSVEVYGHYAPVRLPITKGVRLWNPTAIRVSPRGEIFVANYTGEIYRIIDSDGDGLEDTAVLFCNVTKDGLRYPTSMTFRGKELYVGTAQEIRAYEDTDGDGVADRNHTLLKFPCNDETQYWTFGLCVGPDGFFNFNLSTDSYMANPMPDTNGWRGSMLRVSPDGQQVERMATGLRFTPGLAFNDQGQLFFSDNEGGGNPTEELNLVVPGRFYGHNPGKFPEHPPVTPPLARLISGRAAAGIAFNPSTNDFGGTAGELFIAFWGGVEPYRDGAIGRVKLHQEPDGTLRAREIPFCKWLSKAYDLAFAPSGDLYVTQYGPTPQEQRSPWLSPTGAVYRIIPAPWYSPAHDQPAKFPRIRGDADQGRRIFTERVCVQCHSLDGVTELLGPNLAGLGEWMDYETVLREVRQPSHSIRSGYDGRLVVTDDGESVSGRVVTSDAATLTLMVAGNQNVSIPRASIRQQQPSKISMMPEGLLNGLSEREQRDLFTFLGIQERPYLLRIRHRALIVAAVGLLALLTAWFLRKSALRSPEAGAILGVSALAGTLVGQQFYLPLPPAFADWAVISDWRFAGALVGGLAGAGLSMLVGALYPRFQAHKFSVATMIGASIALVVVLCRLNLVLGAATVAALMAARIAGTRRSSSPAKSN